jgi:hypothetical protein
MIEIQAPQNKLEEDKKDIQPMYKREDIAICKLGKWTIQVWQTAFREG